MAKQVQIRGGTGSDHKAFTGADREVTFDDSLRALRLHDGSTAGGNVVSRNFASYTDLRGVGASHPPDDVVVYLNGRTSIGDGGEGHFRWDSSDLSTEVSNDEVTSGEGDGNYFIAPASDKTGASGAWVRQIGYGHDYQVDSVSDLQSGSFPASLDRIWLSGYYGVGTAGGGPLYRDSADTTTADNGGTVFVDADGVRWKRNVTVFSADEFGAKGDGVADDTAALQATVDEAVSAGVDVVVPATNNYYRISNDVVIDSADGMSVNIARNAFFRTSGGHDGIALDANPEIADQRAFFALTNCTNSEIVGGEFDAGDSVEAGFQDNDDGKAASHILVFQCSGCSVKGTILRNLKPAGVSGATTHDVGGTTVQVRYTGVMAVKSTGTVIERNWISGASYSGYECRIACEDTKFIRNYAEDCDVHLLQPAVRYGQADADSTADRFNRNVLIQGNTGHGERTDITTHAEGVQVTNNLLIDVNSIRSMSFRANSVGVVVSGNTLICTGTKGDAAFQISGDATNVILSHNYIQNYANMWDGLGSVSGIVSETDNNYVTVDDSPTGVVQLGFNAGRGNTGGNCVFVGKTAGQNNTHDGVVVLGQDTQANDSDQVALGARTIQIEEVVSPAVPPSGKGVIYLREDNPGGPQTLTVKFANGTSKDLANDS